MALYIFPYSLVEREGGAQLESGHMFFFLEVGSMGY